MFPARAFIVGLREEAAEIEEIEEIRSFQGAIDDYQQASAD